MTTPIDNAAAAVQRLANFTRGHRSSTFEIRNTPAYIPPGTNPLDAALLAGIRANHETDKAKQLEAANRRFTAAAWGEARQAAESMQRADRAAREALRKARRDTYSAIDKDHLAQAREQVRDGLADPKLGNTFAERAQTLLDRAERADDAPMVAALRSEARARLEAVVGNVSIGGTEGVAALDVTVRLRAATLPGEQEVADAEAALEQVEQRQNELFVLVSETASEAGGSGSVWADELGIKYRRKTATPADMGGALMPAGGPEPYAFEEAVTSTVRLPSYTESR